MKKEVIYMQCQCILMPARIFTNCQPHATNKQKILCFDLGETIDYKITGTRLLSVNSFIFNFHSELQLLLVHFQQHIAGEFALTAMECKNSIFPCTQSALIQTQLVSLLYLPQFSISSRVGKTLVLLSLSQLSQVKYFHSFIYLDESNENS